MKSGFICLRDFGRAEIHKGDTGGAILSEGLGIMIASKLETAR